MKKLVATPFAILLLSASLAAADPVEIKLDMNQVASLQGALKSLDGYTKTVKDGEADKPVTVAYQLGGGLRLALARDEATLRDALTDFQAARTALAFETPGADKPGSDAARKLEAETLKTAQVRMSYSLVKIKADELKLDVNPIPPSVLAGLVPILD